VLGDPGDVEQLVDRGEGTVLAAEGDDPLGEAGADPGDRGSVPDTALPRRNPIRKRAILIRAVRAIATVDRRPAELPGRTRVRRNVIAHKVR
jgi:hypothetical protein